MRLQRSDEQHDLRDAVRGLFADCAAEPEVRRLMDTAEGWDSVVWSQISAMGLVSLAIPETFGGDGGGWDDVGVVLEEAGRCLLCAPYFSTVMLGVNTLLASNDTAAQRDYLPAIANGDLTATLAVVEDAGRWGEDAVELRATRTPTGYRLDGHKSFVIDGATAGLILVAGRTAHGISVFAVERGASGLSCVGLDTVDLTRKQARLEFAGTPARLVGEETAGWALVEHVVDRAAIGLAAEQVGGAQQALDMAVSYAKVRHQFGRPIGSFQAIKHACADMLVDVESARSVAYYGLLAATEPASDLSLIAALAKAHCSDAYARVASQSILVHGAIGYTWEHAAQLHFKRAKTGQLMFGTPTGHREAVAARLCATVHHLEPK
ncbi:acyl-CoA dehydrogenase family protein [Mycolicibacterium pulveris]|uniref:Acyl-CoA dehydrogenase n=1 Tax=Mycolicibacterium pulveris TaxID=36813 RepID=A0A7I7UNZ8_MYCPV|nr:acyl-CoA dehydrogenase family protein [Mycolicibacterium pulveris]MCV6983197.1 acyl-CoA dehydrogenase family protein [Mycolicibacterium pulveris]BBY83067.1 acyl-CoA dehydrogenase [Mycolicibacterium pulveris]